jgi:deferrochelatase/peroxidase EfeB
MPRIEPKTPEERAQLKQSANGKVVQAIQSDGDLTVHEYAERDKALQDRIVKILQANQLQK